MRTISILVLAVLAAIVAFLPVVALNYLNFTETEARVLGSSVVAFSTFGLVIATLVTVLQNKKLVERQETELRKDRQDDYVTDIILPTKSIVETNRRRISYPKRPIKWSDKPIRSGWDTRKDVKEINEYSLLETCSRTDLDSSDIYAFEHEYPKMYERMSKHDDLLRELVRDAESIAAQVDDTIFAIGEKVSGNLVDFAIDETGKTEGSHMSVGSRQWNENREDILNDLEEDCPKQLEEFRNTKREYLEYTHQLEKDLEELRGDISEDYHV